MAFKDEKGWIYDTIKKKTETQLEWHLKKLASGGWEEVEKTREESKRWPKGFSCTIRKKVKQ